MSITETETGPPTWRLLLGYVRPHRWTLLAGAVLSLLTGATGLLLPLVARELIDDLSHDRTITGALFVAILWSGLLRDVLAAIGIALLWRRTSEPGSKVEGLAWKAPAIAILYILCYFCAGQMIAWQSADVRAFYAHVDQIGQPALVALQFGRGLVWCGLAWLVLRTLAGPSWRTALLTGLAFSGLMIPALLFPNPVMPWPVRSVHMVEVGVSNFLFGILAIWILCSRIGRAMQPA